MISREKKSDAQGDLFTGEYFTYREVMTNNSEMTDLEIVEFYNDRGESDHLFDEMNNDFLWEKMPFSFLHENTVFLIMMGICRNLFHFFTDFLSKKLDFIKPNFRLIKYFPFHGRPIKMDKALTTANNEAVFYKKISLVTGTIITIFLKLMG